MNVKKGVFCVDNSEEGVALYKLETGARVRTFPVAATKSKRPRQIDLAEDCSVIISGSDHGIVYVFDRRTGETIDQLRIDHSDWVQTVNVSTKPVFSMKLTQQQAAEIDNVPVIFAAKSRDVDGNNVVFVWKKNNDKHEKRKDERKQSTFAAILVIIFQVMMLGATVAFVHQNFAGLLQEGVEGYKSLLWANRSY